MSVARKIFSNTLSQVLAKVIVVLLGFAVVKMSTKYLGVAGYGEYVYIYEFLAFFGIAADLGLFTIAVKEMSQDESKIKKIIGNILTLRTILVTTTMLMAIAIIFLIPKYDNTRIPLGVAIASISVFVTILNGTISSVLQVKLKMEVASIASVIGKIITVAVMVYVIFFGFSEDQDTGFFMLLVAGIIGNTIMLITTHHFARKVAPLKFQFDLQLWKEVVVKALPYGIALILNTIYFRIDSILIEYIKGKEELGYYGLAMRMLEHFAIIPLYFMNSVLPVLTKSIKEKATRYKQIIKYSFDFLAALSVPIVVGGFILAYPIIFIVSDPEFLSDLSKGIYGSDIALQILIFALLFQFLNVLFAFILIALDKQNKILYINAICVLFNIVTNIIFIPIYGFRGAAVTSVLSELFILIATFIVARRYLEFSVNLKNIFKIILSALVMGAAVKALHMPTYFLLENWNIFLLVPIGGVVYLAMLFLTKTIDKNMLRLLKKGESTPHDGEPTIK